MRDQNEELIEYLLGQPKLHIGDALLHAVREENVGILQTLLDWQEKSVIVYCEYIFVVILN